MASIKQRIVTLKGWLAFMEATKKRKKIIKLNLKHEKTCSIISKWWYGFKYFTT